MPFSVKPGAVVFAGEFHTVEENRCKNKKWEEGKICGICQEKRCKNKKEFENLPKKNNNLKDGRIRKIEKLNVKAQL
jgi:hypothetical protein